MLQYICPAFPVNGSYFSFDSTGDTLQIDFQHLDMSMHQADDLCSYMLHVASRWINCPGSAAKLAKDQHSAQGQTLLDAFLDSMLD